MFPEHLFLRPGRDFLTLLAGLPKHLDAAMPMRRQHRSELPRDIRQLSHLLTDERDDLRRDYLSDPAMLSAYMRYFLPWNIYRLGVLFSGLALDPGGDSPEAGATIIDLGTGPLTAPLALWMARPRLRRRPLHFVCVDRAQKPMRLGLETLKSLAMKHGGLEPWRITLVKGSLDERLREKADLVLMANTLNEVLHRGEGDLLGDAEALAGQLTSMLTPTGQLLLVEPGIRPSAHLISALRRGLLHRGLNPLAPCPHTAPCPMSGRGYTAWCHFNFDAEAAPAWLKSLSDDARLAKDNVSLSFLHFSAKGRKLEAAQGKGLVRAVSGPFELPGSGRPGEDERRYGQYACSDRGLTLLSLPRKHLVPLPGTLLEAAWPDVPDTDAKSGALVLPLSQPPAGAAPAPVTERPASAAPDKPQRKPKRLPSERPAQREAAPRKPRAQKPVEQSAAAPASTPGGTPVDTPGDRPVLAAGQPTETPVGTRTGKAAGTSAAQSPAKSAAQLARPSSGHADDLFADDSAPETTRNPARRTAKKKPGQPAVKKVNKPKKKKGGKSAPKADSRAARKAKKG
ncbi:MAG: small ribosomal subunit Rsm22 family protein [Humidesulfovibrio sp.]|nr:small ribosomal subunit Rsm22 family protein [Humidesulfovibrio sp.]